MDKITTQHVDLISTFCEPNSGGYFVRLGNKPRYTQCGTREKHYLARESASFLSIAEEMAAAVPLCMTTF